MTAQWGEAVLKDRESSWRRLRTFMNERGATWGHGHCHQWKTWPAAGSGPDRVHHRSENSKGTSLRSRVHSARVRLQYSACGPEPKCYMVLLRENNTKKAQKSHIDEPLGWILLPVYFYFKGTHRTTRVPDAEMFLVTLQSHFPQGLHIRIPYSLYIYILLFMHVYIYTYIYIYVLLFIHVYIYILKYIYIYVLLFIHVFIYIYKHV